jgi:alanine racemase
MDAKDALGEPTAFISRSALIHNATVIRRAVGRRVKICAVVKANGYGHDASIVVDALANFSTNDFGTPSVDAFAVADLDEATALPLIDQPVLILRPVENAYVGRQRSKIETAVRNGWWLTVASAAAADDVARIATSIGKRAHLHVMLDTGMSRAGVDTHGFDALVDKIERLPSLRLAGVYTHFTTAEDPDHGFTLEQLTRFLDKTDAPFDRSQGRLLRHACNTGGIFFSPEAHLDLVRPGMALYGIDPTGRPSIDRPLRPALRWTAPLIGIRDIPAGSTVGYGQTWTADKTTRVGLVPIGYADGYDRRLSNRGVMLVHGSPAPVIGRVSMDLTTIDLSQVPVANIGDDVTVLDSDPLSEASVYKIAALTDTISYEVFCRIGPRVRRVAVDPVDKSTGITALASTADDDEDYAD